MPRDQGNKVAPAAELGHGFDLAAALRVGLVPLVVMAEAPDRTLRGYIDLYLQQEVKAEGLVRRLDRFLRELVPGRDLPR